MEGINYYNNYVKVDGGKQVIRMAGVSAYARPVEMPLVAKKTIE